MGDLDDRLDRGGALILDGAIGTELERRGAPGPHDASWAVALDTHPDLVRAVHEDYIRAGAEVITTNTFSSGRHALRKIGHDQDFRAWNELAVRLAVEARDATARHPVWIAGSVAAFGNGAMHYPSLDGNYVWGESDAATLRENFRGQAELLAEAGCDLILLELFCADAADAELAMREVGGLGLPLWISLSAMVDAGSPELWNHTLGLDTARNPERREPLADIVDRAGDCGASALLVMHCEIDAVEPALGVMGARWDGPLGAYPNRTGHWDGTRWVFTENLSPDVFASLAGRWRDRGARIVGGCCGFGPDHIGTLAHAMRADSTTA